MDKKWPKLPEGFGKNWWLVQMYLLMIPTVNLQMPIPVFPVGPQIYALPPLPPVAVPFPVPMPIVITEKPTTTEKPKSKENKSFFVAVPAPYPVPVAVFPPPPPQPIHPPPPQPIHPPPLSPVYPQPHAFPRSKNCLQCPPCAPLPAPAPVYPFIPFPVMRSPVIIAPFPPPRQRHTRPSRGKRYKKPHWQPRSTSDESSNSDSSNSDSSTSTDDSSSSESRWSKKRKKVGHVLKRPRSRRHVPLSIDTSDNGLVKPVLSYISENGDVKLTQRISKDAAIQLILDEGQASQTLEKAKYENSNYVQKHSE